MILGDGGLYTGVQACPTPLNQHGWWISNWTMGTRKVRLCYGHSANRVVRVVIPFPFVRVTDNAEWNPSVYQDGKSVWDRCGAIGCPATRALSM